MSEAETLTRRWSVSFWETGHPPIEVEDGVQLSVSLTISNSPILFGCRTGICGTCLSKVEAAPGALPQQSQEEKELLKILCPNEPKARLACQLQSCAKISIEPLKPA